MDEQARIERILGGDAEAFGYFLDTYGPMVFALVARIVGSQADAEELTQDAFVRAYERLDTFQGNARFSSWLCRIACNLALSHVRKHRRRPIADLPEEELAQVSDEMADDALSDLREERLRLLERAVGLLSDEDQLVVRLYYYDNLLLREIAYLQGTTVGTLTSRIQRIRRKLCLIIKQLEHEEN